MQRNSLTTSVRQSLTPFATAVRLSRSNPGFLRVCLLTDRDSLSVDDGQRHLPRN